jgi:hypothetical protein
MILDKKLSDKEKAGRLVAELERLKKDRKAFEGEWKEAQALVSNVELSFDVTEGDASAGFRKTKRITDRPANYHETLTSGICGYACNPNIKWMKLGLSDQGVMKASGVKDWLEEIEAAQYEEYDNSNLYTEMKIVIDQATIFGFGVMHIDNDELNGQIRYKQINVPEIFLDVNEHNEYEVVFRRFFMTVENAASRFGLENLHYSAKEGWKLEDNSAYRNKEIEILHAVFRRKNKKGEAEKNTDMPFASYFVDISNRHIMEESGYASFPYSIFVWERVGGKKYPISPAIKAVNDIKLLHKTEDSRLTLAQMSGKQPLAVPESMRKVNEIFGKDGYIKPGAIIYYDSEDGGAVPQGISMGNNYPINLEITNSQAENIKDWFYVDFFLMLQQQNIARMMATAVQALQGEKASVMTNMIVNLKKALQTVVQRTYDIMNGSGRLPEMPPSLAKPYGGKANKMRFNFASVLSQVQQQLLRYQGMAQFMPAAQAIAQLGQAYPPAMEALDRYDFDVILQNEARAAHMPETAIREDEEVEAIRQQRAQQQAMQQQAMQEAAMQEAVMKKTDLNEPVEKGSMLDQMTQGGRR